MAIPLILCRLKDDHETVAKIGETALVYFPDWEPVPMEQLQLIEARDNMIAPPDSKPETPTVRKPPAAKKAAEPAAKDKE
jgi:hypothetical protein